MLVEKKDFTMANALEIQLENLREWKLLLKPQIYLQVLDEVIEKNNKGYKSPYDVCRGGQITNIVMNLMYNLKG